MAAVAKLEQAAAVEVSKAMTNAEKAAALLRQRGIARPQAHLVTRVREMNRKRGPPTARS